ncbi:MAG: tripartite tricarboxylate transporter substrate binding protein [Burkholderiales bacterium]
MIFAYPRAIFPRLFAAALLFSGAVAQADDFPNKPITLIVPFPPAGIIDILTRSISPGLSERLGQPVVIENRPGAGGNIGAAQAAKSPADGYTIFMGLISTHAINQTLYKSLPYDPVKDFQPISLVAKAPLILLVNPTVAATSTRELIAYAKANPGKLNFASAGNGSASHIAMAMFATMAQINLTHVPYRGSAPAQVDLMAGAVQGYFDAQASELQAIQSGKLRAIGVGSPTRLPALPDVEPISDTLVGFQFGSWFGLLAPAGISPERTAILNRAVRATLEDPEVRKRLADQGLQAEPSTPAEFGAFIKSETERLGKLVRESGAQVE